MLLSIDYILPLIKGIIHVGAHRCEEAKIYGDIPVKWVEAHPGLAQTMRAKGFDVYSFAATDRFGEVEFHITNNIASSSILPLKEHATLYPDIKEIDVITVPTKTIVSIQEDENFINLDIQGAELIALRGTDLSKMDYVYCEVNYSELYEGCVLEPELTGYLKAHGFAKVNEERTHKKWGDALYES